MGGAWLSSSRLALTNLEQPEFLVYDVGDATVRGIDPGADGPDPFYATDLTSARGGPVMAAQPLDGLFLLRLDADLNPVTTYYWPPEWGDDVRYDDESFGRPSLSTEVVGVQGGLVAWLDFADPKRDGIVSFALPAENGDAVLTQTGFWQQMPTEEYPRAVPILPSRIAATTGENAAVHALRLGDTPFIQRLEGDGHRLKVFPEWPGPLPSLPPVTKAQDQAPWWAAVENASYPASLYADGSRLYLLMRLADPNGPKWDLHAIDPVAESLLFRVRLPTRAVHLTLEPGPRHWALVEGMSYLEDQRRRPKRLLLLDAETIRRGGEFVCG